MLCGLSINLLQTDFLKLYSSYVNNYTNAMETYNRQIQENPQFAQYIKVQASLLLLFPSLIVILIVACVSF